MIACALWLTVIVLVALALILGWRIAIDGIVSGQSVSQMLLVASLLAVPYGSVGALIIAKRPGNAVGWVLWAIGFFQSVNIFGETFGEFVQPVAPALAGGAAAVAEVAWLPSLLLLVTFLPLLFPTGRPPSPRWNWVIWLTIAGALACVMPLFALAWQQREQIVAGVVPADPAGAMLVVVLAGAAALAAASVAALMSLAVRFRRARDVERQQMKWFLLGMLPVVAIVAVQFVPGADLIAASPIWFGTLSLPIAIGIGILRHRLFDIDLLISHTLVWGTLTAFVVGTYVLAVAGVGAWLNARNGIALPLVATGIVAVLFQPARERVQRTVNRFVYGDRDDPYAAVSRLGRRLETTLESSAVLPTIVETVAHAMKLPYAALALRDGEGFALAAAHGEPLSSEAVLMLPLIYNAEPVGRLILAPRAPGEPFSAADRRLLEDLARQAGVAAHAARLTADLQHSRERLVAAREEERRRLRNDLHDGLGPVLSALTLKAETARNLVRDNPDADVLLADIAVRSQEAVADIRRLVYALRPPALDDLGLISALQELAIQLGLNATIAAPALPALPAAVEVAAYRIAQEALTNVARHAGISSCSLSLALRDGDLVLDVVDSGAGFSQERTAGVGLASMRERAAELGGTCFVASEPGSTQVTARLPMHTPTARQRQSGAN